MSLVLQPVDLREMGWQPTDADSQAANNGIAGGDGTLVSPLDKLTTKDINGTGVFDVLMQATKLHLTEEFDANRINGKEYATVYLGALSAVLQTATQFLLNQQQVNKINADIGLVRQQTVTELANTDDSIPVGLGFNTDNGGACIDPAVCDSGGNSYGEGMG